MKTNTRSGHLVNARPGDLVNAGTGDLVSAYSCYKYVSLNYM